MYCNYCRSKNPDDSRYCSECGREIGVGKSGDAGGLDVQPSPSEQESTRLKPHQADEHARNTSELEGGASDTTSVGPNSIAKNPSHFGNRPPLPSNTLQLEEKKDRESYLEKISLGVLVILFHIFGFIVTTDNPSYGVGILFVSWIIAAPSVWIYYRIRGRRASGKRLFVVMSIVALALTNYVWQQMGPFGSQ